MRWEGLQVSEDRAVLELPLGLAHATVRTFDTPGFRGITCYEIRAKSIINKVPGASRVPFQWTINPYRGCSHACTYCFARNTHTYLDLDAGHDFDSRIVVKVNAGQLLRKELAAPRWAGEHIAMGTNVDCYQRAEGRYRLMPQIIEALRDHANPFSILTKGTLILRDLELLRQAADVTKVGLAMSIGFVDERLWRSVEPGTPSPRRRLDAVRTLSDAGLDVGVLMAPILPGITDGPEELDRTVAAIAAAGAASVTPLPLHLRPGAREWYLRWLSRTRPDLLERYRELYRGGSYALSGYQREVTARVRLAAHRHGLARAPAGQARAVTDGPAEAGPEAHDQGRTDRREDQATQLTLL
ncbi:MAG TPA: Rv2578c family radical SAM protein [Chloroflexota bacterium]|nr:Rv2578c family radical SAM protein [Chloroflexota bacterium]